MVGVASQPEMSNHLSQPKRINPKMSQPKPTKNCPTKQLPFDSHIVTLISELAKNLLTGS
jgi:hypothetical protein